MSVYNTQHAIIFRRMKSIEIYTYLMTSKKQKDTNETTDTRISM